MQGYVRAINTCISLKLGTAIASRLYHTAIRISSQDFVDKSIVMSFGFGIGDAIAVADLVLQVWKKCHDAPDTVDEAVKEVRSLKMTMSFLGKKIEEPGTILKSQSEMYIL